MRLDEAGLTRWGARIGESIDTPAVLALSGPLGAGKSVLARAIGAGAGVSEPMPSPTFNLLFRHPAASGTEVVHADLYRIESPGELWELGWAQLGAHNEIVLVEWPEHAGDLLPGDHWWIELSVPHGRRHERDVDVRRVGRPPALAGFPVSVSASRK
jgi:tRNA threonylcarbamoyl adenosine modification protein YjeE